MTNNKIYLNPTDGRKSFYGKCFVTIPEAGHLVLTSYDTKVAEIVDGEFYRLWGGYSATTMRHVNAFLAFAGIDGGGKKFWNAAKMR